MTGTVAAIGDNDFRRNNPKFSRDNFQKNIDRFAPIQKIAAELGITPAQLALAWLLHQGRDIVPIPGTRNIAHLDENGKAAFVVLDDATLRQIDKLVPLGTATGTTLIP